MKRRAFLKAIGAGAGAAFVPPWLQPLPGAMPSGMAMMFHSGRTILEAQSDALYSVAMHPSCWFDLRRLVALDMWRSCYRDWRLARGAGEAVEPLAALMARVKASVEADEVFGMKEGLGRAMMHGEVGSYQSFRMIVSDTVHT